MMGVCVSMQKLGGLKFPSLRLLFRLILFQYIYFNIARILGNLHSSLFEDCLSFASSRATKSKFMLFCNTQLAVLRLAPKCLHLHTVMH